ncbi:MAG: hypothetical protein V4753_05615 [Pseudomonadota bacterium]
MLWDDPSLPRAPATVPGPASLTPAGFPALHVGIDATEDLRRTMGGDTA